MRACSVRKVLGDHRGVVELVMALAFPLVIGMAWLGVEAGQWYLIKRRVQTAADMGAFAGALDIAAGSSGTATAAVKQEASRNGFTHGVDGTTITVHIPPTSGSQAGKANAVEMIVSRNEPVRLAALFGAGPVTITARAVGIVTPSDNVCVLALNSMASKALLATGSTDVQLPNCSLASNSTASNAMSFWGNSTVSAKSTWSAGGVETGGSAVTSFPGGSASYAWAVPNPYAGLTIPTPTTCNFSDKHYSGTLSPGVYCGGIDIKSKATVVLQPGTYYLDQGDFSVGAQAIVSCNCTAAGSGVTIVLTSSAATSKIGGVSINAQASVTLRAPTDTTNPALYRYPGILFLQDSRAPTGTNKFNGGADLVLTGALYFPKQEVQWSGNSTTTSCTQIVADTITFTGNSRITDTGCAALGINPISLKYAALVE